MVLFGKLKKNLVKTIFVCFVKRIFFSAHITKYK